MPEHPLSRLRLGARGFMLVLALLGGILAVRNLPWHLDDYDQAKQAYVSYEMVKEGHWWLQHTPTGRIATKPPLAGWISAGLWLGTGGVSWDFAWRAPGILAAAVLLWLLGRKGRELGGWAGATLAVAAFGLNLTAPRLTTLVRTDMLLALFISLAGFLSYAKLRAGTAWTTGERWQMFAIILGSMLTKGPIAYGFLVPGMVAFWWLQRGRVSPVQPWSGWWSLLGPLAIFGMWAGLGVALSPEFYAQVVEREFLGRFTVGEAAVHHNQPVYFYLLQVLRNFFPWSVALVGLACIRDVRERVRRDPALLWLVCWALGGLIFMSLVPSKRADRVFPIIPPLCLLMAAMSGMLPEVISTGGRRWTSTVRVAAIVAIAVLFAGGYAGYRAWESYRHGGAALVQFGAQVRRLCPTERLAVLPGKDEGMLLYLDRAHFTKRSDAADLWKSGAIDAIVAPREQRVGSAEFPGGKLAVQSAPAREKSYRYVCLVRRAE